MEVSMSDYGTTKNRMEPGGDLWRIDGHIDRGGVPVLPLANLKAQLLQHYQIAPAAVGVASVHAAVTLADGAATAVTTAITNPDFPRNVTIKGNAAGIAGDVVITGTNFLDVAITETIALNAATEVLGTKAFKTVTKIDLPARTQAGDTVSVGIGKKVGIPHIAYNAASLLVKLFDGSTDSGTLAVDSDEIEKNIFSINGTPNGSKLLDLFYLV
jgi:hypothetical protein